MNLSNRPSCLPPLFALALVASLAAPTPTAAASPAPLGRAASAPPELAVTFEEAAVAAAELSPGGEAVFFSVAREPQGYFNRVVRRVGVEGVDALGEARFDLEPAELPSGAMPVKSAWVVADVVSGAFAVVAPPDFELERIAFPTRPFEVGAPGVLNRFRHPFDQLHLLVVRPGVGAWALEAWDLSPKDRDGKDDDRVTTSLADLGPLEETGPDPPEAFEEGDVVAVIDPHTLELFAARIGAPPGGGPGGGGE